MLQINPYSALARGMCHKISDLDRCRNVECLSCPLDDWRRVDNAKYIHSAIEMFNIEFTTNPEGGNKT